VAVVAHGPVVETAVEGRPASLDVQLRHRRLICSARGGPRAVKAK
jgi:hypothetical protein